MKKKFDFNDLMNDWIVPLLILALVLYAVIWLSGGPKPKTQDAAPTPAPTEAPVIVQNYGNLHLFGKDA